MTFSFSQSTVGSKAVKRKNEKPEINEQETQLRDKRLLGKVKVNGGPGL